MTFLKIFMVCFCAVGVVFLSVSIFVAFSSFRLLQGGSVTSGQVVGYKQVISRSANSSIAVYTYYPQVSFIVDGHQTTFSSDSGSSINAEPYQIGDRVQVIYSADFSQHKIYTFGGLWGTPITFFCIGLLFSVIGFFFFRWIQVTKKAISIRE
ncbi:MAG: DUF3592 domain-containing protein [Candidatus Pacebacteria bacterium]|nr:DUF3592 domain-containing protein [Candidatus Paceibacterota bacterium]